MWSVGTQIGLLQTHIILSIILHTHTHTHTHAQWPSTHGGVFECNESPSVLIDLMNKVYVTHPDLLLLCCQLLAQCPTQHHSIQVSSLYRRKEEGGEEGRRGGGEGYDDNFED